MKIFKQLFNKQNDYSYCPYCKSKDIEGDNYDYIEHIICEYDLVCKNCGKVINSYAYGHMMYPETKIGYIKYLWLYDGKPHNIKDFLSCVKECMKVIF